MKTTRLLLLMLLALTGTLSTNAQEAYCAVEYADLSDGLQGATVTYYYDDQRYNWDLTVDVDGVRGENISYVDKLTIVFDRSFANYRPTDTSYWSNVSIMAGRLSRMSTTASKFLSASLSTY